LHNPGETPFKPQHCELEVHFAVLFTGMQDRQVLGLEPYADAQYWQESEQLDDDEHVCPQDAFALQVPSLQAASPQHESAGVPGQDCPMALQ
jgi:hypothetical protein